MYIAFYAYFREQSNNESPLKRENIMYVHNNLCRKSQELRVLLSLEAQQKTNIQKRNDKVLATGTVMDES